MGVLHSTAVLWLVALVHSSGLLDDPFEYERLHIRMRPPAGWRLVPAGRFGDERVEFWKTNEYGPRIQIHSFPYHLSDPSTVATAQKEPSLALRQGLADLKVVDETKLTHNGHPAIRVTATLSIENTYHHVIQRCLFAPGRVFIITCASSESSSLSDHPVFRVCLESVEFLGDTYDPDADIGASQLISPSGLGLLGLGLAGAGTVLRRLSIARLKRMGNWPPGRVRP